MGIVYSGHQDWAKGKKLNTHYVTVEEYIKKDNVRSHVLKQKLIKENYKENKCEICGTLIWQGVRLPLELHHKDGNHFNNSLDNLQILCPNCHSIQEGNAGASIGKYQPKIVEIKESRNTQKIKTKICKICGKLISDHATLCEECYHKSTKGVFTIPLEEMVVTREELKQLIRTTPFTRIGQQFGVSDNAIRKWCDKFNLPRKPSEIKQYTNEEWEKI